MKTTFSLTFILITSVLQAQDLPPWKLNEQLKTDEVPSVYLAEWEKADNAAGCAPLILFGAEREQGISLRRANFHGGWAVAYDTPEQRSSFGIAGAGVLAGGNTYQFPHTITWTDGSYASYGLEGGIGPNYLAYLTVEGQSCLYNVWSARGKEHLEFLLNNIRTVNMLTLKPDVNTIANALAAQVPELNAGYMYKNLHEDESSETLKNYLHYFNEGTDLSENTDRDWITELKMFRYERPAEGNDFVLISYFDGSVEGFHPWLKCFSFDRKTGALTDANLPFTIPSPTDFDAKAAAESYWRTDYMICNNGNIVISASPDMASKNVILAHWDNKTGFTIHKRGIYNSLMELVADDSEADNYVQTIIRPNFQRINAINNWVLIEEKEAWDLSLEGALLTYYYSGSGLEKIVGKIFGESYNSVVEYYFLDSHLSFIYDRTQKYTKSPYDDDFDPQKDFILEERRWYLKNNTCFRGIGNEGKKLTPTEIEEEFLENEYSFYGTILQY